MEHAGFVAAFSTRLGGVSLFEPGGLSLGYGKGDPSENVDENRRRFLAALGSTNYRLVTARQIHSADRCVIKDGTSPRDNPNLKCDALLTRDRDVLLGIQTADCLPILIADPKTQAIAGVHAGWRGTSARIVERTIADLMRDFGVNPRTCLAALGPSACVECYEVGSDVIGVYKKEFGYWKKLLRGHHSPDKAYLDVAAANIQQMEFCGIGRDRIYVSSLCTMHDNELFFSYRKEGKAGTAVVGRSLSVIGRMPEAVTNPESGPGESRE